MKKETEIIIENLKSIKDNYVLEKNAYNLWMRELVAAALKSGYTTYKDFSKLFYDAGIRETSEILVSAKSLRHEDLGEIHSDFTNEMMDKPPYIVSNFCNSLSQETYKSFFGDNDYKIIPRDNFTQLFEDVRNEISNYCIIPIENTSSGKLDNFYDLILNYNLKIVKICDVQHSEGDNETRFALMTSSPISLLSLDEDEDHFEIFFHPKNNESLPRILEAGRFCKMAPVRIDSIPRSNLKEKYSFRIVFKMIEKTNVADFLIFLLLEGIYYTPIGFFKVNE